MYIYIHTYIYIHIYTYMHVYIYIYICIYIYTHTCKPLYMYIYILYICIKTYIHIRIYVFVYVCICAQIHSCTYVSFIGSRSTRRRLTLNNPRSAVCSCWSSTRNTHFTTPSTQERLETVFTRFYFRYRTTFRVENQALLVCA